MARRIMGGDFRAINVQIGLPSQADADKVAELLGNVEAFKAQQSAPVMEPVVLGIVAAPADELAQDAQEPAEQPVPDAGDNSPEAVPEAAHSEPVQPEPVPEPSAPEDDAGSGEKRDEYDPIAAVLG